MRTETKAPDIANSDVEQFHAEAVNKKENRSLYEARKKIHPKRASGAFRRFKWQIMIITLGIYYLTPWLRWDRGPGAPDQAVLIDMANHRFYFFFIEIWPHEFFYVAGLLVMAGIGLFLVTSILGRAWCGYTCPQTVWVDLYLVVERFFEGDRNARIKLDAAPWSGSKIFKRAAKHIVWIFIGVATGGAWIFYFGDAPQLFLGLVSGTALPIAYITIAILTATTYIFGGFMREQVCIYMCPWPRIQAAMMDEKALTVTYNAWRGEDRNLHAKRMRKRGEKVGDCVDCNACVAVCPMGIDIRDGQQMECITCALCIDACDNVMDKLGLERGLIAYSTLDDYTANMQLAGARGSLVEMTTDKVYSQIKPENVRDHNGRLVTAVKTMNWDKVFHLRTYLYLTLYGGIGFSILTALAMRQTLEAHVLHDRNPLYVKLSNGSIRNGYEMKILNMRGEVRQFWIETIGLSGALMRPATSQNKPTESLLVEVDADKLRAIRIYVTMPKDKLMSDKTDFHFRVTALRGAESATADERFEAPREFAKQEYVK